MSEQAEREALKAFARKEELSRNLSLGVHGNVPQIKRRERGQLLGQFRERVLWGITQGAERSEQVIFSLRQALDAPVGKRLYIRSDFIAQAMPYVREAQKRSVAFTIVETPDFTGNVTVVLAADQAVDISNAIIEK
jgi:uncharacterized protein YueI